MASATATKKMREEAKCSICLELMTEPVSIDCGHSFCRRCIEGILEDPQGTSSLSKPYCPLCRTPFQRESLRSNKQLENLIQALKERDSPAASAALIQSMAAGEDPTKKQKQKPLKDIDSERLCEEYWEKLCLFCEDDGQLICWRCEHSPQHRGHRTALVKDVYPGYKEKLQDMMTKLKEEQGLCEKLKLEKKDKIRQWEENIELRRQEIQSKFWTLRNLLDEEERAYLWRLDNEKEQLLRRLQEDEASLGKQSFELESLTLKLEKMCQESDENLLQGMKDTLKRHSDMKLKVPEDLSLDPQIVCNVSELYCDVRKIIKRYQVSVTLDPDTAHCELIVSEDRRRVTRCSPQKKQFSIKRFRALPCVLGCEGFTSGRRYFEVHVGEGSAWDIGVCLENVQRDRVMTPEPQSGFWAIRLCQENGYMALTSPPTSLTLKERPLLVGVLLDYKTGLVSFYNMNTGSHIFTFPRASFSGTLWPYFQVNHCYPLSLPPPLELL